MIRKIKIATLAFIICIASAMLIAGCLSPGSDLFKSKKNIRPDPETGIQDWMDAVNQKDVSRIYDLAPGAIKSQINEEDFAKANADNLFLKPGVYFTGYDVLDKTTDGYNASISAQVFMQKPDENGSIFTTALFYKFVLIYEGEEWKIWTVPQ